MSEARERWLAFAHEDLRVAEIALPEGLFNQVCFHSQQCVEKALKALLAQSAVSLPRTHAVSELINLLPSGWLSGLREKLAHLDAYYIPTRYPDALPGDLPEGLPGKGEAEEALGLAREVMRRVDVPRSG